MSQECWLTPDGVAWVSEDGGHSEYVLHQLVADLLVRLERAGLHIPEIVRALQDEIIDAPYLREALLGWFDSEQKAGRYKEQDDVYQWLASQLSLSRKDITRVFCADGSQSDLRDWALQTWQWIRVSGLNLQVHGWSRTTRKIAQAHLADWLDEQNLPMDTALFVEDSASGRWFDVHAFYLADRQNRILRDTVRG